MPQPPASTPDTPDRPINFFRPRPGYMSREVVLICLMLLLWGLLTFGFQLLLVFNQQTPSGQGPLTESVMFGFPLHYWFTGQFLIICFIRITSYNVCYTKLLRVFFFVKATLAAIPAVIILVVIFFVVSAVVYALLGGDTSWMMQRWRL